MKARYETFSFDWQGLTLTCRGDFEPEERTQGETSGYPGYQEAEVLSVDLDDASEFLSHGILEECSEGVERMALALITLTGKLFPALERKVMQEWREEMDEAADWAWSEELG